LADGLLGTLLELLTGLSLLEQIYLICAVAGGFGFALQVTAMVLGGIGDLDIGDGGADLGDAGGHHHIEAGYKVFSLQSITAFLLMFGLSGFVLLREDMTDKAGSILWACVAGTAALGLVSGMFTFFARMQASGTMTMSSTVGCEGVVYLTIPAEGTGKVTITVQESLREFEAISKEKTEIRTDERIRVTAVEAGILVVEKI
jgi:hypothetical protein